MKLLIALVLLFANAGFAEESCGKNTLDLKTQNNLISSIQTRYDELQSFSAKFSQNSYLDALAMSESSSGEVFFKKQGKMLWHYQEPDEQIFTVKDNSLWLYQVADKQVLVDSLDHVLLSELPVSFLMGLGRLSDDFNIKSACKVDQGFHLILTPKQQKQSGDSELKGFELIVDSVYFPIRVVITDGFGNVNTINLKDYKLNALVTEDVFITEYPDDVDVNDKRASS